MRVSELKQYLGSYLVEDFADGIEIRSVTDRLYYIVSKEAAMVHKLKGEKCVSVSNVIAYNHKFNIMKGEALISGAFFEIYSNA